MAFLKELIEKRAARTLPAKSRPDEEIINVATQSTEFHGVPDREYRITCRDALRIGDPDLAARRVCQQRDERGSCPRNIKLMARFGVELLHECHESICLIRIGAPD